MDSRKQFVREWYAWIRHARPTTAFYAGRRNAPEYDVECEIDHLISWVSNIGQAHLGEHRRDFVSRTHDLMSDADDIATLVIAGALSPFKQAIYLDYLRDTRKLLEVLRACHERDA